MKFTVFKAVVMLAVLHLVLMLFYFGDGAITGSHPVSSIDYGNHYYNVLKWIEMIFTQGRTWGYDSYFMAGYPFGTYWGMDMEGSAILVFFLHCLGLGVEKAFNFHLIILFTCFVPAMYAAGRIFKLGPVEACAGAGIGILVWYLDPCVHWEWLSGMYSFLTASYLCVLLAAIFFKYMGSTKTSVFMFFSGLALFVSLLHPVSGVTLVFPAAASLIMFRDKLGGRMVVHLGLFLLALVIVSVHWIWPLIIFREDFVTHGRMLQANLSDFARDIFGGSHAVNSTPYESIFAIRRVVYLLGIAGIVSLWKKGEKKLATLLIFSTAPLTVLTYLGYKIGFFSNMQPYRFMVPLLFFMVIPAPVGFFAATSWLRKAGAIQKVPAVIIVISFALGLSYDFTRQNPHIYGPQKADWKRAVRLTTASSVDLEVLDWIKANTDKSARIFCDNWVLSRYIVTDADREVIGGPHFKFPMKHGYANLDGQKIFGRDLFSFSEEELKARLETFNIKWLVVRYPDIQAYIASMPGLFQLKKSVKLGREIEILNRPGYVPQLPMWGYAIYEANIAPSWFLEGSGKLSASLNRIVIDKPSKGPITIKYHWMKKLITSPPLKLDRKDMLDDPVGFITINNNSGADRIEITTDD